MLILPLQYTILLFEDTNFAMKQSFHVPATLTADLLDPKLL